MAIDISPLVRPETTAIVINECQEGIVGRYSSLPALAHATRWVLPNIGRLVAEGRQYGVSIFHCIAARRPDGRGGIQPTTMKLTGRLAGLPEGVTPADTEAVVPEISVAATDFVVTRYGGMGGLSGSGAVAQLHGLGIKTLVLAGVSLNMGVLSMLNYGIDNGFDCVVASDAVAGVPREYGEEVLRNSVRVFAPITTIDALIGYWHNYATASNGGQS